MSKHGYLSHIVQSPCSQAIHSLLAVYGSRRGTELPGPWFVEALTPLGHSAPAVRQALLRLVQRGELVARKDGRTNHYRFSELLRGYISTGTEKIFGPAANPWDRQWTLVHYQFAADGRVERDQVREILEIEGFGQLGRGVFLHPRDRIERVHAGLRATGLEQSTAVFRARWMQAESERDLAARVWPLDELAQSYGAFLDTFGRLHKRRRTAADAFALRLALALAYLNIAWDDPDLPHELLPKDWPGHRAREVTASLYEHLLPGTLAHGDRLLAAIDKNHEGLRAKA